MTVTIVSQWSNQCHCVPVSVGILPALSASYESYDLSILNKADLSKRWVQEKTESPHWHCTPTLRNGINDNLSKETEEGVKQKRVCVSLPTDGVVPPSIRFEHNSNRLAPARKWLTK